MSIVQGVKLNPSHRWSRAELQLQFQSEIHMYVLITLSFWAFPTMILASRNQIPHLMRLESTVRKGGASLEKDKEILWDSGSRKI